VDFVFLKRDVYPSGKNTSFFLPSFLPSSILFPPVLWEGNKEALF
jgi:hypothetical protein